MTYFIRPDWLIEYLDQLADLPAQEQVEAVRVYAELHTADHDLTLPECAFTANPWVGFYPPADERDGGHSER